MTLHAPTPKDGVVLVPIGHLRLPPPHGGGCFLGQGHGACGKVGTHLAVKPTMALTGRLTGPTKGPKGSRAALRFEAWDEELPLRALLKEHSGLDF